MKRGRDVIDSTEVGKWVHAVASPIGRRVRIRTEDGRILEPWHEVPADYRPGLHEVVSVGQEIPPEAST